MSPMAIAPRTLASTLARDHGVNVQVVIGCARVDDPLPAIGATITIPKKSLHFSGMTGSEWTKQLAIRLSLRLPVCRPSSDLRT